MEVVGLVLQSPEEAITATDEVAQSSRRKNEEGEHAQNVQLGGGIVLALSLLADLGASSVLGSSLFAGVWLSLAHFVGHCDKCFLVACSDERQTKTGNTSLKEGEHAADKGSR